MKFSKEEIKSSMLLYAVTDRMWLKEGESLTKVCEEVLENGATFLQIREKDLDEGTFEEEAKALKDLCEKYHVP
ncbi:MAG: thiamine phosphate synthase, partial [Clostridium sp.]